MGLGLDFSLQADDEYAKSFENGDYLISYFTIVTLVWMKLDSCKRENKSSCNT